MCLPQVSRLEFQEFQECSFLKDEQNELEKHKQMSSKNMDVLSVKCDLLSKALEQLLSLDTIDRKFFLGNSLRCYILPF